MLKFLSAGIPHTTKPRNTIEGLKRIKELGLDGMEMEWVHQVPFDEDGAKEVRETANGLNIDLTVHGSYYINLASKEKPKWHASINRVLKAAKIGKLCGAKKLTFHPAFYQGRDKEFVFEKVQEGLEKILHELEDMKNDILIAPELTGKPSQFGDLDELVNLSTQFEKKIKFCIDFSHLHARTGGKFNSTKEFKGIFDFIIKNLGKDFLSDMYFHLSGILYTEKGERRHVCFLESQEEYEKAGIKIGGWEDVKLREVDYKKGGPDIKWREILKVIKDYKVGGHLVCESPNLEQDTLLLKRYYEGLK